MIPENGGPLPIFVGCFAGFHEGREELRTNRKYKVLTFTFDEWDKIEKLAERCRMKTATLIKTAALKGKVFVIDLKENREYVTALNRIGQNINQIARIANETGYIHPDDLQRLEDFRLEICRISRSYQSKIQSLAA